jgi:phosphopantothenoylcysteine decarboxylase / phosphopantothenate---cysteine ligase
MKILLGITGSIASYKSYDLARSLVKNGHEVRVILTQGALEFIKPQTFRYLGVQACYLPGDDFNPSLLQTNQTVLHVELAKWADKLVIAPLSANTLARLSLGLNNDLLVSVYLAFGHKPILLFPAMNTQMWQQPKVQRSLQELKKLPHLYAVNPVSGPLACGDEGEGKFPDINNILDLIETLNPTRIIKKKIIVTAGATAAPLDPVRYITNPSSGRMGIAVAKVFLSAGYEVCVLAGHACSSEIENLSGHPRFKLIKTPTTALMKEAAVAEFPDADLYISTGAIADIEFDVEPEKMKKEKMGNSLSFHQAADILKEIIALKRPQQKIVSFAAETQTTHEVFSEKIQRKPVDLMVGNKVANGLIGETPLKGFQATEGEYFFILPNKISGPISLKKQQVGQMLLAWFEGEITW